MAAEIPDDLAYLLTTDVVATMTAIRRDGTIAMYYMWVDYDGEHILTSSLVGSRKAHNWRRNPVVTLAVVDHSDPWRYLIIRGRVVDTRPDDGLAFIDKMSLRYTGGPYLRRTSAREIFVIEADHVRASSGRMPAPSPVSAT